MKIYDVSQEVFSCEVFPGDPSPRKDILTSMCNGDMYNLCAFYMCAHNGTHIDAPLHFLNDGKSIDQISLEKTVGYAYVAEHNGSIREADMVNIIDKAKSVNPESAKKILIKGDATLSIEAAQILVNEGVYLYGNESQTVGAMDALMKTHQLMLGAEIVLLEGIRLCGVPEGAYLMSAAPLNLGGSEGAPCRAILIEL